MVTMEAFTQFVFLISAAAFVGFACITFVFIWVFNFKEGLAWDGGLAEFNWHPVLIVIGLIFLQGIAIIVYRLPWTWKYSKLVMKFTHAGLNSLAFILTVVALVAVFDFHNAAKIPNMYSLHSWVGLAAVILYSLQLVLGIGIYLIPITPVALRATFMPLHIYSGLFIFASVLATALMGITEKLIFGLKDPKYKDSPPEATFVNILGILILVFGALVLWIATRASWKRPSDQKILDSLHTNGGGEANTNVGPALSEDAELVDPETCGEVRRRSNKSDDFDQDK